MNKILFLCIEPTLVILLNKTVFYYGEYKIDFRRIDGFVLFNQVVCIVKKYVIK